MTDRSAEYATKFLPYAVTIGSSSPCCKSKRGVVTWDTSTGEMLTLAHNRPPDPFVCTKDAACKAVCGKVCVHAEEGAMFCLTPADRNVHMLHVKVVDGEAVPSGPPSCVRCSAKILAICGITGMWLLHEDDLRLYDPVEFHKLSLQHHGYPCTL